VIIWCRYIFPFWYVIPVKIWQPSKKTIEWILSHVTFLRNGVERAAAIDDNWSDVSKAQHHKEVLRTSHFRTSANHLHRQFATLTTKIIKQHVGNKDPARPGKDSDCKQLKMASFLVRWKRNLILLPS
jgi:hypothetical protein